jgi:hypothetical protein
VPTTADLAADFGVDQGDIALVLARLVEDELDLAGDDLPADARSSSANCFTRRPVEPG